LRCACTVCVSAAPEPSLYMCVVGVEDLIILVVEFLESHSDVVWE